MDNKQIQDLIDLYWDCATTPSEEKAIRAHFASHDNLPAELEQWRSWFQGAEAIGRMKLDDSFDEKILSSIEQKTPKIKRVTLKRILYSSVAAAAVLFLAYFSWMKVDESRTVKEEVMYAEAMQEYEMVKEMLYFTSSQMNRAETVLEENLSKMEIITEYINIK